VSVVVWIGLLGGAFFLLVSSIGVIRLPDFYSRSHASAKSETLGAMLVLGTLALYNGLELNSVKLLLVLVLVALTSPTGIHALARAALRSGLEIWTARRPREAVRTGEGRECSGS